MMGEVEGLIGLYQVLAMLQLKPGKARGVSHQTAYMSNCYSHVSSLTGLVCCIGSGKSNVSRVALHEFDITFLVLQDGRSYCISMA